MRILFAEDDRDLSRAVKALLEHSGYSVDAVCNGQDALDYGMDEHYDCIILDLMMPKKNGLYTLLPCARYAEAHHFSLSGTPLPSQQGSCR